MYQVSSLENYLLVTFKNDVDSLQIMSAIKELFSREDYSKKNDIWVFEAKIANIRHQDLKIFAETLSNTYPPNVTRSKTALVVDSLFHSAIASEFI
ncbi:MAG: hypothetical protein KOO60_11170 [Gemmatimonadales bacterium]|nr:hypothetical protein [Gemmatimonadales bacterium]